MSHELVRVDPSCQSGKWSVRKWSERARHKQLCEYNTYPCTHDVRTQQCPRQKTCGVKTNIREKTKQKWCKLHHSVNIIFFHRLVSWTSFVWVVVFLHLYVYPRYWARFGLVGLTSTHSQLVQGQGLQTTSESCPPVPLNFPNLSRDMDYRRRQSHVPLYLHTFPTCPGSRFMIDVRVMSPCTSTHSQLVQGQGL